MDIQDLINNMTPEQFEKVCVKLLKHMKPNPFTRKKTLDTLQKKIEAEKEKQYLHNMKELGQIVISHFGCHCEKFL